MNDPITTALAAALAEQLRPVIREELARLLEEQDRQEVREWMTYKEVGEYLGINWKTASHYVSKHNLSHLTERHRNRVCLPGAFVELWGEMGIEKAIENFNTF